MLGTTLVLYAFSMAWAGGDKVEVCHRTPNGTFTLEVADQSIEAHLAHGDHLPSYDGLCGTELDGWVVTAGAIEEGEEPGTIYGVYTMTPLPGSEGATRGGGGCVLADVFEGDPSYECDADADCADVWRPPGGFSYCASPAGSNEPKRCWVRPGNLCIRSQYRVPGEYVTPGGLTDPPGPDEEDWTTPDKEILVPVYGDAQQTGVQSMRWMVIACMSTADAPMGCGTPDPTKHAYSTGPAFVWTPPE